MSSKKRTRTFDLAALGWSDKDLYRETSTLFGIERGKQIIPPGTQTGVNEQVGKLAIDIVNPLELMSKGQLNQVGTASGISGALPMSAMLTPQEQLDARAYAQDPRGFVQDRVEQQKDISWIEQGKGLMSRVFDIEDEVKESAIESVWDNTLSNLFWSYDRIRQGTTYGVAKANNAYMNALGFETGVPDITWDQANQITEGQILATSGAQASRQLMGGQTDNFIGSLFGANTPMAQAGFNILDPEQQKKAFQDDAYGRWTSGVTDAVFSVFTDPLIYGGYALKLSRVKYLDRPIVTQLEIEDFARAITDDAARIAVGESPNTTQGQFIKWVLETDEAGKRVRTAMDIYEHQAIRWSGNRDALTGLFTAVDNPQDAALVFRAAYGDNAARADLLNVRADLAFEIGNAEKNAVMTRIAYDPEVLTKQVKKYDRVVSQRRDSLNAAEEQFKLGKISAQQLDDLKVEFDRAIMIRKSLDDFDVRSVQANPVTQAEVKATKADFEKLIERDEFLRKALDDDISGAFKQSYKTFSKAGPIGLAFERSRERRAVVAAQTKAENVAPWKSETFYNVGGLQRTVNLWRWAWAEKPSGYIAIRGVAANEQGREFLAMLNTIPEYKGNGVQKLIDGKPITIGGNAAKEELFEAYVRAVGGSVKDQNQMALVLDGVERRIMDDIAMYHGLPEAEFKLVFQKATMERAKVLKDIKERKFFVEEVPGKGGGKEIIEHKVPYLESQLENGTYLINFGEFSRLARKRGKQIENGSPAVTNTNLVTLAEDPIKSATATGRNTVTQSVLNAYNFYNNLWRPATLLRLGYVQRNAAEGLFRATAYTESLLPLGGATMQTYYAARNTVTARAMKRDLKKLDKSFGSTALTTKRFDKWRQKQEVAMEVQIAEMTEDIARTRQRLNTDMKDASPALRSDTELNLAIREQMLEEKIQFRNEFVNDDIMALSYYRAQGGAKRRMFDGTSNIDGIEIRGAFADPNYSPIALANLSSDPTIKMNLSLRDRDAMNYFKAVQEKEFVQVRPGDEKYFEGVARMLRQYRNSEVGMKILQGESPESIARWLITDKTGREIAEFVTGNVREFATTSGKGVKGGKTRKRTVSEGGFDTADYDGALGYVRTVTNRLEQLAPSPELRALLRNVDVDSATVQRLLDTPEYSGLLKPAVGNITVELGAKPIRETYRNVVNKLFQWAGTMPEDTFVRTPFYGARYASVRDEMIQNLRDYYTNIARQQGLSTKSADVAAIIPLSEITRAHRVAHRRALKDTRDWLYTIDRRTNLGHYGEYIHPFITSAQNSVTAIGRMVWKNPALPEMMRLIWQAPQQAGIEDERGNIVFTMPLGFIPESVRNALSLDSMLDVKIPKTGLNVVFPESGFGVIPRFGPFAGVPIQAFMQYGFFGLGKGIAPSGYTPDWLENVFGKDTARGIWDGWRDYVFGEDRVPSTAPLMADVFLPPAYKKLTDLWQGFGSNAYASTYEKIRYAEMIRIMGNEREEPENMSEFADEIQGRTNWHMALRFLGNILAFTPPQYEFIGEPLVQTRRMYDRSIPEDADKAFYETMGSFATMFSAGSLTKNVAGLDPTDEAIKNAAQNPKLVREIMRNIKDPSVLGAILNGDPENEYSPTAISWQTVSRIPGTSENYRRSLDPVEGEKQQSVKNGWVKYLQLVEGQDAIMQQRGLTSLQSRGAEDLLQQRRDFLEAAKNNPLYNAWYQEYITNSSSRTNDTVLALKTALSNDDFLKKMKGNTTFEAAAMYLDFRSQMIEAVRQSPYRTLRAKGNKDLANTWDSFRQTLINRYPKWGILANRYLNGDDDPTDLGYQWWQFMGSADDSRIVNPEGSNIGYGQTDEELFGGP